MVKFGDKSHKAQSASPNGQRVAKVLTTAGRELPRPCLRGKIAILHPAGGKSARTGAVRALTAVNERFLG